MLSHAVCSWAMEPTVCFTQSSISAAEGWDIIKSNVKWEGQSLWIHGQSEMGRKEGWTDRLFSQLLCTEHVRLQRCKGKDLCSSGKDGGCSHLLSPNDHPDSWLLSFPSAVWNRSRLSEIAGWWDNEFYTGTKCHFKLCYHLSITGMEMWCWQEDFTAVPPHHAEFRPSAKS